MSIRVILGDDHKIFREGLRVLLEKEADIQVVGEAGDGRTTVKMSEELLPDLVIIDISMPDLNGIEATHHIIKRNPQIKVIALSMYSDRRLISGIMKAGALGYVIKDSAFEELVQAIRAVKLGRIFMSPSIMDTVLKDYFLNLQTHDLSVYSTLTAREREVLQCIAEGKSVKEIASELHASAKTIETHRHSIMTKLNIHSTAGLTKYAIREGLTSL